MRSSIVYAVFTLATAPCSGVTDGETVSSPCFQPSLMSDHPESAVGQSFAARLAACSSEDFDGHTEFATLSPEHGIEWLDQATWFLWECRKNAAPLMGQEDS